MRIGTGGAIPGRGSWRGGQQWGRGQAAAGRRAGRSTAAGQSKGQDACPDSRHPSELSSVCTRPDKRTGEQRSEHLAASLAAPSRAAQGQLPSTHLATLAGVALRPGVEGSNLLLNLASHLRVAALDLCA